MTLTLATSLIVLRWCACLPASVKEFPLSAQRTCWRLLRLPVLCQSCTDNTFIRSSCTSCSHCNSFPARFCLGVLCKGSSSTPPRSPLRGAAADRPSSGSFTGSGPLQLSDGGLRPRVTKLKGSQSAPEGPVSPQQKWQAAAGDVPAAAGAAAVLPVQQQQQQQQPDGLQHAVSAADEYYESFSDANELLTASESGSVASAAAADDEQQQQQQQHDGSSSSSEQQQLPLPYTEAELGVMIGGTLNRQYWESIHDGVGSVRDVYSIRGPHYLRDKKKIPAGVFGFDGWLDGCGRGFWAGLVVRDRAGSVQYQGPTLPAG